ncbi:ABC transporter substrate-binding protein [Enterovirga rhinocerotis]|uniref:Branched-chain amino acid transport system substrate-binding protein n=1 Tax=Enterovirga rhinocerotis TaxID=1339210 RepID=A0A4R7BZC8_9HYPH|nr:ABC transporter substrate-binding protein [Enterovirga rhinocerotis]TDR89577.1 branched-chain amino acid transport system substrate-binding protein [Enterovirga rhinocerotis]
MTNRTAPSGAARFGRVATASILTTLWLTGAAMAQEPVRIGIITDMSGPYSSLAGPGVVIGTRMAIEEFGGKVLGRPIEVLSADSGLKADISVSRAREWYDQHAVQMIIEASDSASAVALQKLGESKKRISFLHSGTTALTNADCSPYGIHYAFDTYSMAGGAARAAVKAGGKSWYFVTADYVFGKSLEGDAAKIVKELGGTITGSVRHPLNAPDFASYLLSAQQSKAQVVALANAGRDAQNAVKQAAEFGLGRNQTIVPLLMFDTDIVGLGLKVAQGMELATAFYWDLDDRSRAFSKAFTAIHKSPPTMNHAGAYSATLQYLKAVEAVGSLDPDRIMAHLRSVKLEDAFSRNGRVRVDGRMVHDIYHVRVKTPEKSTGPHDIFKVLATIEGDDAFMPLADSTCRLVKK